MGITFARSFVVVAVDVKIHTQSLYKEKCTKYEVHRFYLLI